MGYGHPEPETPRRFARGQRRPRRLRGPARSDPESDRRVPHGDPGRQARRWRPARRMRRGARPVDRERGGTEHAFRPRFRGGPAGAGSLARSMAHHFGGELLRAAPSRPSRRPTRMAPALRVLGPYLRNTYLHRAVREQGGAYGAGAGYARTPAPSASSRTATPHLRDVRGLRGRGAADPRPAPGRGASRGGDLGVISDLDRPELAGRPGNRELFRRPSRPRPRAAAAASGVPSSG